MEQPHQRRRRAASHSFTKAEIDAVLAFVTTFRRGGDARLIARSTPMMNVERKFTHMKQVVEKALDSDEAATAE